MQVFVPSDYGPQRLIQPVVATQRSCWLLLSSAGPHGCWISHSLQHLHHSCWAPGIPAGDFLLHELGLAAQPLLTWQWCWWSLCCQQRALRIPAWNEAERADQKMCQDKRLPYGLRNKALCGLFQSCVRSSPRVLTFRYSWLQATALSAKQTVK